MRGFGSAFAIGTRCPRGQGAREGTQRSMSTGVCPRFISTFPHGMSSRFLYTLNLHNCSRLSKLSYIDSPAHTFDRKSPSIHFKPLSFVPTTALSRPQKIFPRHASFSSFFWAVVLEPELSTQFLSFFAQVRDFSCKGPSRLLLRAVALLLDEVDVMPQEHPCRGD